MKVWLTKKLAGTRSFYLFGFDEPVPNKTTGEFDGFGERTVIGDRIARELLGGRKLEVGEMVGFELKPINQVYEVLLDGDD